MLRALLLLIGMLVFGLLASDIIGGIGFWVNLKSAALVVLGTMVGGMLSAPVNGFRHLYRTLSASMNRRGMDLKHLIDDIVGLARFQRVSEVRELSIRIAALENPFLRRGLELALDHRDRRKVEESMENDISRFLADLEGHLSVVHAFARLAPVFGFVGTVVGLINVLNQLGDASQIGHGMAISLLTTFYGLVMANFIFVPLAGKLTAHIQRQTRMLNIVIEGVLAVCDNCAPLEIAHRLESFLDAEDRLSSPKSSGAGRLWQKLGGTVKQVSVTTR